MTSQQNPLYRELPSVDELLRLPPLLELTERSGLLAVTEAARVVLADIRGEISAGRLDEASLKIAISGIGVAVQRNLQEAFSFSLRTVINATGVILHTNLGRAPLSESAVARLAEIGGRYSNLEFNELDGGRGKRDTHIQQLILQALHLPGGVHDTVVVNNCAAAVMLVLNSLADGGEVVVSRGELVEIGGGFRIPEVMAKSGALLREVGTTNRTRIGDYENAITENTRLLMRVHRSNFALIGFTEQPSITELVDLGRKLNIPVVEDLGHGALIDLRAEGLKGETGVFDSLNAGIDLITYSGDKLLGGPQAGIITGRKEWIAKLRKNPLLRALRADKLNIAALEATLHDYLRGAHDAIPALRMMRMSANDIRERAEKLSKTAGNPPVLMAGVLGGESVIGGGTTPSATLPTFLVALAHARFSADELLAQLRLHTIPIIARVDEGRVLLDLRTVFPEQDKEIAQALRQISQ